MIFPPPVFFTVLKAFKDMLQGCQLCSHSSNGGCGVAGNDLRWIDMPDTHGPPKGSLL